MKIQFFNGGLANQAFQYIFARYYELSHHGQIMYLDDSYFAINTVHNGYELEKVFGIKPHMLSECYAKEDWEYILEEKKRGKSVPQVLRENGMNIAMVTEVTAFAEFNPFNGTVMPIPCNGYYPEIMEVPGDIYYHGYWINKKWINQYLDVFREEFTFPAIAKDDINSEYMRKIHSTNSVSVHIRRGDYVNLGIALETDTYMQLITLFHKKYGDDWTAFVFSDDIEWCKKNAAELGLTQFHDICFVEGNVNGKNYRDMQLMTECKGMIMSNSAFCYLAALLRKDNQYLLNCSEREV